MGRKKHPNRIYRVIGEPGPGTHGVGYVRFSSDMQDPATLITQKRKIEEFFERKRWILDGFYEEPEHSAKYEEIEQRPVFAQMLAYAGSTFRIIVCYMNDRWARNVTVAFNSLAIIRRKGVWWATADGQFDLDRINQDGADVWFVVDTQINAAFVRKLSKREIDAFEDRGRAGYHNGKTVFGYLRPEYEKAPDGAPSTWRPPRAPATPDPVNFPALVRIGELAAQGWTDQAIAAALPGYTTNSPRFGARPLTKDTIAAIRGSWFPREFAPGSGKGTVETPAGELVEGLHPAAWPYELYIKYNHLLANCVIFANTVAITTILADLTKEGYAVPLEAVAALSSYLTAHIIRFGRFAFDRTRRPPPLDFEAPLFASAPTPETVMTAMG